MFTPATRTEQAIAPEFGLSMPSVDLHDDELDATGLRSVSADAIRRKRARPTARLPADVAANIDDFLESSSKRRKTGHSRSDSADEADPSDTGLGSPPASPGRADGQHEPVVRRQQPRKFTGCLLCLLKRGVFSLPGFDVIRIPAIILEWVYYWLAKNEYWSIWECIEDVSLHLCSVGLKSNLLLPHMSANAIEQHYLEDTRDQYVWLAKKQITYSFIEGEIDKSILFRAPTLPPDTYAIETSRLRDSLRLTRVHTELNNTAATYSKAFLGSNTNNIAERMTCVDFVLTKTRVK